MDNKRLTELFWKYTNDSLAPQEEMEFFGMLADERSRDELKQLIGALWEETRIYYNVPISAEGKHRIAKVMDKIKPAPQSKSSWINWRWVAAACLLLLLCTPLLRRYVGGKKEEVQQVVQKRTISTGFGQKKTVKLPDSSIISLNAGSTLVYTDDFNVTNRTVVLVGEAFFEVNRNEEIPFTVQTGKLYTQVLGTSFNVRAFDEDEGMSVAVASGRVDVSALGDSLQVQHSLATLFPGQELKYNKYTGESEVGQIKEMGLFTLWKDEVLVFDGDRFSAVAKKLERWYNVRLHFEGKALENCRFTGVFDNLPVNKVLDLLRKSSNFSYQIDGKSIHISGKGCIN